MQKIKKLSDLTPDNKNINKHSQYGMALLEKSIREVGWTEAVIVSRDGVVMSGNARSEKGYELGFDDAQIVESDGTKPVIIIRTDIVSATKQFVKAKILANTVSKHNYIEDCEVMEAVCEQYEIEAVELGGC